MLTAPATGTPPAPVFPGGRHNGASGGENDVVWKGGGCSGRGELEFEVIGIHMREKCEKYENEKLGEE
ncbi:uncharacterized protein G2W53_024942 [Senna tora]|uniref:Uncharacterized protein n=1 Tax=Senna tora TaxID=362788 RepID=A0A834WEA1_9FABA|nr:uncharacterized protein G2W53_024942 [Senna tora]